jgi:MoxR-like ATPase
MSIFKTISIAFNADLPVFFRGPPGIGKSAIVRQVAGQRGWTEANRRFVDVCLSHHEPTPS